MSKQSQKYKTDFSLIWENCELKYKVKPVIRDVKNKQTNKSLLIEKNRNICKIGTYDEKHIFIELENFSRYVLLKISYQSGL